MTRTIQPDQTGLDGHKKLDMRISTALGEDLAQEIRASVAKTQQFMLTELPDILVVTQSQFASLNAYTEEMYHTTDRMFLTPHNVMEVVIDRDVDIVPEIEEAIQDIEDLEVVDNESDTRSEGA